MAEIKKRGKKKYLVRVFIGRKTAGKSPYLDKVIHGDKKKAIKYANETEAKRDLGLLNQPTPSDPTLKTYLNDWFTQYKKPTVKDRTSTSYKDVIDFYLIPYLGEKLLSELTTAVIQTAYNKLSEDGYSPRTIAYAHTLLSEALDQAARDGTIPANPSLSTRRPVKRKPRIQVLSPEEADRFMKEARPDKHGVLFWLALATGLRPEEYLGLAWPELDIAQCAVTVRRTVYFPRGGGWKIEEVKTTRACERLSSTRNWRTR
jgi:integrase